MRTDFTQWEKVDELELLMEDDTLEQLIKDWKSIASKLDINKEWEKNKNYYLWIDKLIDWVPNDKSKTVDNRIFTNVETIVPIVTSKPAKPVVFIPNTSWKNKAKENKLREQAIKNQKILLAIYRDQKLQAKFEKLIRQHQIYKTAWFKYGIKDGKIFANVVLPTRLLLDSEATCVDEMSFIWEKVVSTAWELAEKYPNKADIIYSKVQQKKGTKITYIEWWTNDYKVIEFDGKIIDKKKNPLFDYGWEESELVDDFGEVMKETKKYNLFNKPRIPYIPMSVYNLWESIVDDTTPLVLSKSLQDDINKRKRQISDNADKVWNPIRQAVWFKKEQVWDINDNLEAGDAIMVWDGQSISYIQAVPLPAYIMDSLQDSRNSIDNIFGIHSTTRWERTAQETATGREILRSGDEDRQATLGRAIENISEELYYAFAHLVRVYYDKPQLLPIIGESNTEEYLEVKRDDIAEGMKIIVHPWSTLPDDPLARKTQALKLAELGKITNRKLFEELGIDWAAEEAEELELEAVKAQKRQQEELNANNNQKANENTMSSISDAISNLK